MTFGFRASLYSSKRFRVRLGFNSKTILQNIYFYTSFEKILTMEGTRKIVPIFEFLHLDFASKLPIPPYLQGDFKFSGTRGLYFGLRAGSGFDKNEKIGLRAGGNFVGSGRVIGLF